MKVILLQDLKGTGKKNQLVEVSNGYARNYLFPKKLAVPADSSQINTLQTQKEAEAHRKEQEKEKALALCESLKNTAVTIPMRVGQEGRLFGAVTGQEIAQALKEQHQLDIDRKKIVLENPIRHVGTFEAELKLYPEVSAKIYVTVKPKE